MGAGQAAVGQRSRGVAELCAYWQLHQYPLKTVEKADQKEVLGVHGQSGQGHFSDPSHCYVYLRATINYLYLVLQILWNLGIAGTNFSNFSKLAF